MYAEPKIRDIDTFSIRYLHIPYTYCARVRVYTSTQARVLLQFPRSDSTPLSATLTAMTDQITNLVQAGPFSWLVDYEAGEGIEAAIHRVFTDVPRVAKTNVLLLQRKDKEWGEFVDIGKDEAIADWCVVKVVLDVLPEVQVRYSVASYSLCKLFNLISFTELLGGSS